MFVRLSLITAVGLSCATAQAVEYEIDGSAGIEQRYFLQDPAYPGQIRSQGSVFIQPQVYMEWNDGDDSLTFQPFYRWDQEDDERSHGDIRELMWLHVSDNWEFKTGVGKVFWGQTESLHLVDIINQTDSVEAIDGEDKLGQPMVSASYVSDWGTFSGFVLPYFRERTFADDNGRLRPPFAIDVDNPIFESSDEENHVDYALRWQHSIDDWEVGLSYFSGTTREPELIPVLDETGTQLTGLRPLYAQIKQTGLDVLKVDGAWLWKLEAIYREGQSQDFWAAVAGAEYTLVGVLGSDYDLGFLIEYQFDERNNNFFATGQNDVMFGTRVVLNDIDGTEWLLGFVKDYDDEQTYSGFIEASSRMSDSWRWSVNAYFFSSNDPDEPLFFIRRDDHVSFSLEYFF